MQSTTLFLVIAFLGTAAFFFGRSRSLAMVGGRSQLKTLHSLPGYYGYFTAIWCLLPALAVVLLWVLLEPRVILAMLVNSLPEAMQAMSQGELNLLLNNIQNLASGDAISGESNPMLESAAAKYVELQADSQRLLATLTLGLAGVGGVISASGPGRRGRRPRSVRVPARPSDGRRGRSDAQGRCPEAGRRKGGLGSGGSRTQPRSCRAQILWVMGCRGS